MREPPLILIVDDDPDFASIVEDKLKSYGYDVVSAPNGELGYEKAREQRPDLILMDVKMPVADGVEGLLKIREDPVLKDTKVVFLTAFGERQPEIYKNDQRFAKEIGASEYLLKNEDLDKLAGEVGKLLGRS